MLHILDYEKKKHPQTRPPALKSNCSGCLSEDTREPDNEARTTRGRQHVAANQVGREVNNRNLCTEI